VAVVDFGKPGAPGTPDGILDLVVTAQSQTGSGSGQVLFLPGLVDGSGQFAGFGAAVALATVGRAGPVVAGDFDSDGATDLAVADKGGVTVVYGQPLALPPNTTLPAARNLGSVAHLLTLPQAIVTGHDDAFFTYTVPTEAVAGAGAEVVDISARFQFAVNGGLRLEVLDANGKALPAGSILQEVHDPMNGDRLRVRAAQGTVLTIHVFGCRRRPRAARGPSRSTWTCCRSSSPSRRSRSCPPPTASPAAPPTRSSSPSRGIGSTHHRREPRDTTASSWCRTASAPALNCRSRWRSTAAARACCTRRASTPPSPAA